MAPRARRKWKKKERKNLESSHNFSFDTLNYEEFSPKVILQPDPLEYNPDPDDKRSLTISVLENTADTPEEANLEATDTMISDDFMHMVNSFKSLADELDVPIEDVLCNIPFELFDETPPYFYNAPLSSSDDESDDEMSIDLPPITDPQIEPRTRESILHGDQCPGPTKCPEYHIIDYDQYYLEEPYNENELKAFEDIISSLAVESTELVHFGSSAAQINCLFRLMDEYNFDFGEASDPITLDAQDHDQLFTSYMILSECIAEELDTKALLLPSKHNVMFIRKRYGSFYDEFTPPKFQ